MMDIKRVYPFFQREKLSFLSKAVHYSNIIKNNSEPKAVSASLRRHIEMLETLGELSFNTFYLIKMFS